MLKGTSPRCIHFAKIGGVLQQSVVSADFCTPKLLTYEERSGSKRNLKVGSRNLHGVRSAISQACRIHWSTSAHLGASTMEPARSPVFGSNVHALAVAFNAQCATALAVVPYLHMLPACFPLINVCFWPPWKELCWSSDNRKQRPSDVTLPVDGPGQSDQELLS